VIASDDCDGRFVAEIVKALIFIHDSSILHLDLKPQNIMLVEPGQEFRWWPDSD
jgi:serine/threonine protein kinase